MPRMAGCELCDVDGGEVIVRTAQFRVLLIDDVQYPGFCRVVWHDHVSEMTDLLPAERNSLMTAVCKVEQVLREIMLPHKVNLASLGNMVPHLHWHLIPRYLDDAHFPAPVWSVAARTSPASSLDARRGLLPALRQALRQTFIL